MIPQKCVKCIKNERNKKYTLCKIENLTIEKWVQAVSILIQVGTALQIFRDWPTAVRGLLRFQTFVLQKKKINWWQIFVLPAKVLALRGRSNGDVQNDSGQIIVKLLCGRPSGIPRGCSLAAGCVCMCARGRKFLKYRFVFWACFVSSLHILDSSLSRCAPLAVCVCVSCVSRAGNFLFRKFR